MKQHPLACALAGLLSLGLSAPGIAADKPQVASQSFAHNPLEAGGKPEVVSVAVTTDKTKLRQFTLTSSQQQRDDKEKTRSFSERSQYPQVHSNSLLFDALFSMAIDDMQLDSVKAIRDFNYNMGDSIPCDCFETGEKWNYVWTRDLSYSVNLSLAQFDPARSINSMLFKTSGFRDQVKMPANLPAQSLQILQDTGSGGSWPVSTDRVTWALAAKSVLQSLTGAEREAFANKAYAILRGTIEADRLAVFDAASGLYGGEQSYMDWRTQTYAPWIVNNLSRMSESKALSTNVLHFNALSLAAELAREKNDTATAEKYTHWAAELKQNINNTFWLKDVGLYSTMTTAAEDTAPVYKYDMLGNSLAILLNVASHEQAEKIIASYPNTPMGVPVYYPQMPNIFVYHNRSMWPFVTAYALNAAVKVGNDKAADNAIQSLVRGAALNLSNMENLEWLTGKPYYDDGPMISSRRQLWSVAAYLGMVSETIFGVHIENNSLQIQPFLTPETLKLLGNGKTAQLDNIPFKGHKISVQLQLPTGNNNASGSYKVAQVELNGKAVSGAINEQMLATSNNLIKVSFGELQPSTAKLTIADNVNPLSHDDAKVFAPEAPVDVKVALNKGKFSLSFSAPQNSQQERLIFNVYKNGKLVTSHLTESRWQDSEPANQQQRNCFSVESQYASSGNKSLHSEPVCDDGKHSQFIPVTDKRVASNLKPSSDKAHIAKPVLAEWGAPSDSLQFNNIVIKTPGKYAIQVVYNNRQHTIDSGVTNAVKTVTLLDSQKAPVKTGTVQMPNVKDMGENYPLNTSTEFKVELNKGKYSLQFGDYFNMSYLTANTSYRATGGTGGPVNKASIAGIKIVRIE